MKMPSRNPRRHPPRRHAALFEKRREIKKSGDLVLPGEAEVRHGDPIFTKSYLEFESIIANKVSQQEEQT